MMARAIAECSTRQAGKVNPKYGGIGLKLLEIMHQRGIKTQAELAIILGVSPQNLSKFMLGKRKPGERMLRSMAERLEVSTDYLLDRVDTLKGTVAPRELDPSERKALSALDAPDLITAMEVFLQALREYHQQSGGLGGRRVSSKTAKDEEE